MGIIAGFSARQRNNLAVGGYFGLALLTLLLSEALRRRGISSRLTRKLVHVVAGISPLYVATMATDQQARLLPYRATVLLNALAWRAGWPRSLGSSRTPGIVYFPLIQWLLLRSFWSSRRPAPALAGLLTMALADASASLVGERWGRHRYTLPGIQRSAEGSGAMFLVSAATIAATLRAAGEPRVTSRTFRAAALATLAEALSPLGTDNLSVPIVVATSLLADGVETGA